MALEQIVRAEGHELPLLAPHLAFHHQADSSRQVIVADAGGHTPKVFESADMSVEEALLLLAGKGHHKAPSAVGQPHHKDLHRLPDPADDGDGLPPIYLRILAGVKRERERGVACSIASGADAPAPHCPDSLLPGAAHRLCARYTAAWAADARFRPAVRRLVPERGRTPGTASSG